MPIDSGNKWEYNILSNDYAKIINYRGSMSVQGITLPPSVDGYHVTSYELQNTALPQTITEVVISDGVNGSISSGFFPISTRNVFIGKDVTGLNREFNNCKKINCVFFNGPKPYWRPTVDLNDTVFPWEPINLMGYVTLWYREKFAAMWDNDGFWEYNVGGWEPGFQYGLSDKYYASSIGLDRSIIKIERADKYNKFGKSLVFLQTTGNYTNNLSGNSWSGEVSFNYRRYDEVQCVEPYVIPRESGLWIEVYKNSGNNQFKNINRFVVPQSTWSGFDIVFNETGDYIIKGLDMNSGYASLGYGQPDRWFQEIKIKAVYDKSYITGRTLPDYTGIYTDFYINEDMMRDAFWRTFSLDFTSKTLYEFDNGKYVENFNAPTTGFFPSQTGTIGMSISGWSGYYSNNGYIPYTPDQFYFSPNGIDMPFLFFPNSYENDSKVVFDSFVNKDISSNNFRERIQLYYGTFNISSDFVEDSFILGDDSRSKENFNLLNELYYSLNNFSGSYDNENFGKISKIVGLHGVDKYGSFYWTPGVNIHVDPNRYPSINFMVSNDTDYLKVVLKISTSIPQLEYSASIRPSYNGVPKFITPITTVPIKKLFTDAQCITNEYGEMESYWELILPIDKTQISAKGTLVTIEILRIHLHKIKEYCPYDWQILGYDPPSSRCRDYSFEEFADFPWVDEFQRKISTQPQDWMRHIYAPEHLKITDNFNACNLYLKDNHFAQGYGSINIADTNLSYVNENFPSADSSCAVYQDDPSEFDVIIERDLNRDVNIFEEKKPRGKFVGCFNNVRMVYFDSKEGRILKQLPLDFDFTWNVGTANLENQWMRNASQLKFCNIIPEMYFTTDDSSVNNVMAFDGPFTRNAYSCPGMGEFEIQFTNIIPYKYKKDCLGSWPIKFTPNTGQTGAYLFFSGGKSYPISDQNGWDWGNTGTGGNNPYSESLITHPFTGAERIFLSKRTGAAFWKEGPWWITTFAHPLVARINANPPINNIINLVDASLIEEYDFISYKCTGFISGLLSYDIETKEFTYSVAETGINGTGIANALNSGHKIYITEPISDNNIFDWVDYYPHEISGNRFKLERRYIPSKIEINQRDLNIGTGFVVINSSVEPTSNFSGLSFIYPNNNLIADNLAYAQLTIPEKNFLGYLNKSKISNLPLKKGVNWHSAHLYGGYNGYFPNGQPIRYHEGRDTFKNDKQRGEFMSGILTSFPTGYENKTGIKRNQTPLPVNYKGPYV
jgi:hypothetical protein